MTVDKRIEVRLGVARGHWTLAEYDEALESLARAVSDAPEDPAVSELIAVFHQQSATLADNASLLGRIAELASRVGQATDLGGSPESAPPVATSTVAELLERQGHRERALEVACDVLRRRPDDVRAQAVRDRLTIPDAPPAPETPGGSFGGADAAAQVRALEGWLESIVRLGPRETGGAQA